MPECSACNLFGESEVIPKTGGMHLPVQFLLTIQGGRPIYSKFEPDF